MDTLKKTFVIFLFFNLIYNFSISQNLYYINYSIKESPKFKMKVKENNLCNYSNKIVYFSNFELLCNNFKTNSIKNLFYEIYKIDFISGWDYDYISIFQQSRKDYIKERYNTKRYNIDVRIANFNLSKHFNSYIVYKSFIPKHIKGYPSFPKSISTYLINIDKETRILSIAILSSYRSFENTITPNQDYSIFIDDSTFLYFSEINQMNGPTCDIIIIDYNGKIIENIYVKEKYKIDLKTGFIDTISTHTINFFDDK